MKRRERRHLCLERDRFLRVLEREWERERERRDLRERLDERFLVSALGGEAAASVSPSVTAPMHEVEWSSGTWFDGGSNGGLGLPHPPHHALQLFGGSLRGHLRRLHDGVVGMIDPSQHTMEKIDFRLRVGFPGLPESAGFSSGSPGSSQSPDTSM